MLTLESETKGTNFVSTLRSLRELRGTKVHDDTVAAVPGPGGEALRQGRILPVGWYPVPWYVAFQETIHAVTGGGVAMTRALARTTTERDFQGLHRVLVRMLSPQTAARHAHRLVQLYWRGGKIDVRSAVEGRVRVEFTGWRGFDVVVWEDLAASIEAALSVVGAEAPRSRVLTMSADRTDAEIETRFGQGAALTTPA